MIGTKVKAYYMSKPIEGTIIKTEIKAGYIILHTIKLDTPFTSPFLKRPKTEVLVDNEQVYAIVPTAGV
jgi:hypothetical protein